MNKKDREKMQDHLRQLGMLGLKANVKHHIVVDTISTHSKELLKMYKAEKKKNENLRIYLDKKQYEIDDLTKENLDQSWNLTQLEKNLADCKKVEGSIAHYEKRIKKYIKKESVDH